MSGEFNIYLVVSEKIETVVWEDWFSCAGHKETYCIAELVVAASHTGAKWLAWKNDRDSYTGDVRDMPRMSVRIRRRGVDGPARVVSQEISATSAMWN